MAKHFQLQIHVYPQPSDHSKKYIFDKFGFQVLGEAFVFGFYGFLHPRKQVAKRLFVWVHAFRPHLQEILCFSTPAAAFLCQLMLPGDTRGRASARFPMFSHTGGAVRTFPPTLGVGLCAESPRNFRIFYEGSRHGGVTRGRASARFPMIFHTGGGGGDFYAHPRGRTLCGKS